MGGEPTRRAGRPRTPLLTTESIVDAALAVLSEAGAEDFTMARLASRLGVRGPALYNHVRDRRALINLMRTRIAGRIDADAFDRLPWHEAIVPWAHTYRRAFAVHPHLIALLAVTPIDDTEASLHGYEKIARGFVRGGWDLKDVVPAIVAIESFIIGSSLDVMAAPDNLDPGRHEEELPTFTEALRQTRGESGERGVRPADLAFDLGLRALVKGLRDHAGLRAEAGGA